MNIDKLSLLNTTTKRIKVYFHVTSNKRQLIDMIQNGSEEHPSS